MKHVSLWKVFPSAVHWANHSWNMIIQAEHGWTIARGSFKRYQTKHVQNGGWMQTYASARIVQGRRTPQVLVGKQKLNPKRALNCWPCRKLSFDDESANAFLFERCIALLLRRAWKLTPNQRMNATVTVIFSSILQLKCLKFMRVPWKSINYSTMHKICLKPTSGVTNGITEAKHISLKHLHSNRVSPSMRKRL